MEANTTIMEDALTMNFFSSCCIQGVEERKLAGWHGSRTKAAETKLFRATAKDVEDDGCPR